METRDPARPPADPRPKLGRVQPVDPDRSLRLELGAALLFGVVLVVIGLYLWRRPHVPADTLANETASQPAPAGADDGGVAAAAVDAGRPSPVTLTDARVLGCHDRGPKRTPADQCDHLSPIEKALANAVEQSASCIAPSAPPVATAAAAAAGAPAGTIEYVADVSFLRHKVSVLLPRSGRSVRDRKVLAACATAVRGAMGALPLEGVDHQHARYRISVTATYRGSAGGG